ncbi:hypothetical protein AAFO92_20765 [Roseovarius sp. CAU 1744]|uniref:hypothetical protein n=1 Tax=Roseovarius sp. CAU 1744 TaxID=3140368 RepID=UPI00325BBE50
MKCFKDLVAPRLTAISLALLISPVVAKADPGVVAREDLVPFGQLAWSAPNFQIPIASPGLPLLDLADNSPEATLLRRLDNEGRAAGFKNVVYDNHDRGHSLPKVGSFPRVPKLQFSDELKELNLDYGLAGKIILPAIVIGNSSTAITKGQRKRSQPRLAMTTPAGPARAFLTYVTNHLYIYPEHRDYDDKDLFPANWPYMVIAEGSSHNDKPFIRALLMSLAAMSPETQKKLQDKNLIAPTLQMIMRRSMKTIYTRQSYLSGLAHPPVFSKKELAPERMVTLAASLKPDEIPPMVFMEVEEEDFSDMAGLAGLSEKMFNTPSAIARIWRSTDYTKRMVVSAGKTADPNGHALSFNWVVLRGDPERVRITPIGENGAKAEISIDWHNTRKIVPTNKRLSNRVDIGVFAWNGFNDSAPAIISFTFPGHQEREYQPGPDGESMRLTSVNYDAKRRKSFYDPVLYWSAPWTDILTYDDASGGLEITRQFPKHTVVLDAPDSLADGKKVSYTLNDRGSHRVLKMDIDPVE